MTFSAVNPATGRTDATYPDTTTEQLEDALNAVEKAQQSWGDLPVEERTRCLQRCAALLRDGKEELAHLIASEMGKVVREGRGEIDKCAWVCDYYAEHQDFLADQSIDTDFLRSYVSFRPLGTVLAIMPWNFPFWQVFRFAAPALLAGNGILLKHASNVPGCALAIEKLIRDAGVPEDLFHSLFIDTGRTRQLIADPRVQAATLTGSTRAGRSAAAAAGEALKKMVLELGGSDAYLILEDADLEGAVEACVQSRMINCGQSCIAAKRFIVAETIRPSFEEAVLERILQVKMGNPFEDEMDIGPMATADLRDGLHDQVQRSVDAGARKVTGGLIPDGPGAFYPPTLLTEVRPGMPAFDEEIFGPVAAVVPARDEREAIRLANASSFGLGAAVFTRDLEKGERIAAEDLEAGCCFVNDFVRSDPRLPFGGIKESGYGRELSEYGLREFVNVKTVVVSGESS